MKPEDVFGIVIQKLRDGGVTDEQIGNAVEKYYNRHPLETDKTLSVSGGVADAKTVGDELVGKVSGAGIELFYNEEKQCLAVKVEG